MLEIKLTDDGVCYWTTNCTQTSYFPLCATKTSKIRSKSDWPHTSRALFLVIFDNKLTTLSIEIYVSILFLPSHQRKPQKILSSIERTRVCVWGNRENWEFLHYLSHDSVLMFEWKQFLSISLGKNLLNCTTIQKEGPVSPRET